MVVNYHQQYTGLEDPGQVIKERLPKVELQDRLQHMFAKLKELLMAKDE